MDKILIIDDDETFNGVLKRALKRRGHVVEGAMEPAQALAMAREHMPDGIVLDLNLAGSSGLSLIQPLLEINSGCRIVVLTGYASIATAVDAIKLGAVQYLAKPVEVAAILAAVGGPAGMGTHPAHPARARRQHFSHGAGAENAPAHTPAQAGEAASQGLNAAGPRMAASARSSMTRVPSACAPNDPSAPPSASAFLPGPRSACLNRPRSRG
jgi:ActR/RegA family two-component response regulator